MKKYVLAFLAFVGLNFAGLFCIGFVFGIIAALGGETDPQAVQQSAWIDFLVILQTYLSRRLVTGCSLFCTTTGPLKII